MMYVPRGMGRLRFSPAVFVCVNTVSSAFDFGILMAGGKYRSVSLKTLYCTETGKVSTYMPLKQ